ncbi:LamG domain-containing protein [Streptomyces phaeolivaceus]|uniref:LamG domain-containing protein n=1 Tax=Streptomyces phaeolivaceus TaxID=2653200 RepID=A0A5P8KDZ4_9ACTN|nr:LamG domain-containing protein [Streptomyces phaeolivaceus]QFR01217.1 LamG domain-containing protein [Streptomyces phaeolivaceus]
MRHLLRHDDSGLRVATGAPLRRRLRAGLFASLSLALVAGAGALTTATQAQAEDTDGLVLRYKLDEWSGTVAQDSSGHNHDGQVNGTVDWDGAGLSFNGSNTYVKVPNNIMAGLNSITVSFEVLIDQDMGTPYMFYGLGNTSGSNGNGYLFTTGNGLRTSLSLTDYTAKQDIKPADSSYQLARGTWKQVTYTQTGQTGILYEDGVEKARKTNVTITPGAIGGGTTTANYIGRSLYANDKYFKGRMRDFRIYDRALSASQVAERSTQRARDWEQTQALASHNGGISAFEDPDIGPVIIFPKDHTGDIDNLEHPPGWTDSNGQTPTSWVTPTTAKSLRFTYDDVIDAEQEVYKAIQPEGDPTYAVNVHFDGMTDRMLVETQAPASVTDPLAATYGERMLITRITDMATPAPACTVPEGPLTSGLLSDSLTQVQVLAAQNCALAYFEDPEVGAVIIFPKDYTGDIDDLQRPTDWKDQAGEAPSSWPTPLTAKSPTFTAEDVREITTAAYQRIAPDGSTTYKVSAVYDGMTDRIVVNTDAPASVTDPLLSEYPDRITVAAPLP